MYLLKILESVMSSNGHLVDLLADIIPKISIDVIKIIAEFYDIFKLFESFLITPYWLVHVCTMCSSVDSQQIHLAGFDWKDDQKNNNPKLSLGFCCMCQHQSIVGLWPSATYDQEILYDSWSTNLIIRSSEPFIFNKNGSLRLSSPHSKPIVSVCAVCDKCLFPTQHNPTLSTSYVYVISHKVARNRSVFFCPYWLARVSQPACVNVPEFISCALLGNTPPKIWCQTQDWEPLDSRQKNLLVKFGTAHINKLSEDILLCDNCRKPNEFCALCHRASSMGFTLFENFHICYRPSCWGLFFPKPQPLKKLLNFCNDECKNS